jgi:hypothetical protein
MILALLVWTAMLGLPIRKQSLPAQPELGQALWQGNPTGICFFLFHPFFLSLSWVRTVHLEDNRGKGIG